MMGSNERAPDLHPKNIRRKYSPNPLAFIILFILDTRNFGSVTWRSAHVQPRLVRLQRPEQRETQVKRRKKERKLSASLIFNDFTSSASTWSEPLEARASRSEMKIKSDERFIKSSNHHPIMKLGDEEAAWSSLEVKSKLLEAYRDGRSSC